MERTLVLLKPDAVQRGLVGTITARFEAKGLQIVGLKARTFERSLLEKHYEVHKERPFYGNLVDFMSSGPVVAMALEGKDAITVVRTLVGKTNAREAAPGTIRGDYGMSGGNNLVHGSDSPESAERELKLWFGEGGIVDIDKTQNQWVYDPSDLK